VEIEGRSPVGNRSRENARTLGVEAVVKWVCG